MLTPLQREPQSYQEEQRQAGRHISTTEAVTHITKGAQLRPWKHSGWLIAAKRASGAIAARRIVIHGSSDGLAAQLPVALRC
ncbi:hypothetical protein ACNUIM_32130 [Pseudomonas aeruginosa]|uniref:hypothetical protein n=1 Tax=Pseudomonas aeruginosa TaxID=287 RepID=UPI003AAB3706